MKNEVRPIDANALAKKIREYMEDLLIAETSLAACRAILSMLGDEQQTPTLDHTPDVQKMTPLTLEQLREMDGKPAWIEHNNPKYNRTWLIWRSPKEGDTVTGFEGYGKFWRAYAYPPAHINREAWEPCEKCGTCESCEKKEDSPVKNGCILCDGHKKIVPTPFCQSCGRPQTEEAWAILERRIGGE